MVIKEADKKEQKKYEETRDALIQYINENETNPNEKVWNQIAIEKGYLSSKTMGYIEGIGFNLLCKKIRKEIQKKIE